MNFLQISKADFDRIYDWSRMGHLAVYQQDLETLDARAKAANMIQRECEADPAGD